MSALQRRRVAGSITNTYKDFARNTSIHGLKYTVHKSSSIYEKVLWVAIVFLGLIGSLFMLNLFWEKFNSNPTRTVIFDQHAPVEEIPFPAITVCPIDRVLTNKFDEFISTLDFGSFNKTRVTSELLQYFHNPLAADLNISDVSKILISNGYDDELSFLELVSQSCHEMILVCMWNNKEINCNETFVQVVTSNGICCSFNYKPKELLITYEFGFGMGLKVLIDPMLEYRDHSALYFLGIKVYVHYPTNHPSIGNIEKIISPGNNVIFQLSGVRYICSEEVRALTKTQRNCLLPDELKLKYFSEYSRENCLAECRVKSLLKTCKCVLPYYGISDGPVCKISERECYIHLLKSEEESIKRNQIKCSQCHPQCEDIFYDVLSCSINFVPNFKYYKQDPTFTKESNNNVVLNVYFYGADQTVFLRDTTTSVLYLLSSFGGIFSLFLGCSFISGLEILYYVFVRFFINLKEKNKIGKQQTANMQLNSKVILDKKYTDFAHHGSTGDGKIFTIHQNRYFE